jgi:predicted ATPase/DNA-binding CsgD family transcriptional regulator
VLIIVDNCEHLIADSATVSNSLLKDCPSLKVMATSREPLGIPGETTYRVPSLSLPKEDSPLELEALPQYEAVRLFIERAIKSRPNFKISNDNASAVVHICSRLEGIPLAIELAAARVKVLTPQQISDGLAHRFHLLTGGSRTVMPRQQTLQASVDWSYQLLTDAERSLLDSLSVFSGGFTLDAAEAIGNDDEVEPHEVLDLLGRLVDKSLVIVDDDQGSTARYRLLETIRQYAMERLVEKERVEAVRTRHMEHFVEVGKLHLEEFSTLAGGVPREIQPEVDNFRAAVEWAINGQDREAVVRLVTHLSWFLIALGRRREAATLFERALESESNVSPDVLSRAWTLRGWVGMWFDAGRNALAFGERSLELAEKAGDEKLANAARALIAQAAFMVHDTNRLETLTAELERSAQSGSFEHIFAIELRGHAAIGSGSLSEATSLFKQGLELSKSSGNLMMIAHSQQHVAFAALFLGDFDQAEEYLEAATKSYESLGSPDLRNWLFSGRLDVYRGDYSIGREKLSEALRMAKDEQLPGFEAIAFAHLLMADLAEGDFTAAAEHGEQFDSLTESLWDDSMMNLLVGLTADRYRVGGLKAKGLDRLKRIRETGPRPGAELSEAIAAQREAKIHREEGDLRRAEPLAFVSLEAAHRFGSKPLLIECIELVAGLALDRESFEEAARLFAAADAARQRIGYVRFGADQPTYDSDVNRIKEAIEDEPSSVWDAGSKMTLDEAVTHALRGRGERKRPSTGWAALTPAERRVADLVDEGLSNPQIADRLFISRNTVETHLKHIFSKLSISSRAQLAKEVARNMVLSDDSPD